MMADSGDRLLKRDEPSSYPILVVTPIVLYLTFHS